MFDGMFLLLQDAILQAIKDQDFRFLQVPFGEWISSVFIFTVCMYTTSVAKL
jgi:hypothetical protein